MRLNRIVVFALWVGFLLAPLMQVCAQQPPTSAATSEHKWLKKFAGSWKTVSKANQGGQETEMKGAIESKMLGEFWLLNRMTGKMDGFSVDGRQTIGYDSKKKKYVGTWVDSTNEFIWHYEGHVEENGRALALHAEGPDMAQPGKMAMYRDRYEFTSKDEIKFSSSVKGPDGKWIDFMTGVATRAK